jgi:hypothetical protein
MTDFPEVSIFYIRVLADQKREGRCDERQRQLGVDIDARPLAA